MSQIVYICKNIKIMSGIYIIKNKLDSKIYIGSCKNFKKRCNKHISELNNNIHHNIKLQRSWNKYREDNFEFELIEQINENKLLEREQYWIDLLNPYYNINRKVGGWNNKSTSLETSIKISKSKDPYKKEVYKFDILGNFIEKFNSITDAAKSINKTSISHIIQCCKGSRNKCYGYRWSYTKELLNNSILLIEQRDLDNNLLNIWKSYKDISLYYDIPVHILYTYINKKFNTRNKILKKYLWIINK